MPHYAAIEPDGKGLMIVSYKSFTFVLTGQDLEENKNETMSEKIKGSFTLSLHRACMCLYNTHLGLVYLLVRFWLLLGQERFLILFPFILVVIVFCKIYYLNSMNCFN